MSDISNYPVIQFVDKSSNFNKKKRALKINEYLVSAYVGEEKAGSPIKIYKLCTGLPLIDVTFTNPQDAINVAEWITKTYGEYFPIWDQYPDVDIFSVTKWTVPDGIRKYEAIRLFSDKQKATQEDLKIAYRQANIDNWTYEHLR